ncbi:MAG: hypothetical protein CL938_15470 [Deltaproteobacteria bacterium]|jgi:hypothetical protein|nr:hypothetical protein [Deltaproteobacteria bacterium]
MGKTHDALRRAEEERQKRLLRPSQEPLPRVEASGPHEFLTRPYGDDRSDFGDLKKNLLASDVDGSAKRILFVNTFDEGESSDRAIGFAASLSEHSNLRVLIIDMNPLTRSLQEASSIDPKLDLFDLPSQGGEETSSIEKIGPGNLYTVKPGGNYSGLADLFESEEFDQFLENMNERFDYLILDTPRGASFQECRILCSKMDAVVLVMESNETTGQIALSARRCIEDPSDKLLGAVVNQAKPHKPEFIKPVSMVVVACLIFGLGLLVGTLRVQSSDPDPGQLDEVALADVDIDPTDSGRIVGLALRQNYAGTNTDPEGASEGVQNKTIGAQARSVGGQFHASSDTAGLRVETGMEESPVTPEAGPSASRESKKGQASGSALHEKAGSDSSEADEELHDVEQTPAFPSSRAIEEPVNGLENGSDEKGRVKDGKSRSVVVKEGDNLYRIILGTYGRYNKELVRLVLSENPEISNVKNIAVGRVIRLPEAH